MDLVIVEDVRLKMKQFPIFIGGLAHSGKTPLRLFLSRHPNLSLTRQTYMWNRFYNRYGDLSEQQNFEQCLADMLQTKGVQALQPDPERIRREFRQGEATYGRLFGLFHEHNAERAGKSRWGDQLGFVERFAEPIFAAYPQAKMIHMIRDPRDRYEVTMTLSRHRKGKVGWDTARWLHSAEITQKNQHLYPDQYKVVRYEIFRANPEETLHEICLFLGEEFVPDMLASNNVNFDTNESDNGQDASGKATIQIDKIGDNRLSKGDLLFTQAYAKQQLLAFDYALESPQLSLSDRLLFYLVDWPVNYIGMAAWYMTGVRAQVCYSGN
jgi:hypothetical protein